MSDDTVTVSAADLAAALDGDEDARARLADALPKPEYPDGMVDAMGRTWADWDSWSEVTRDAWRDRIRRMLAARDEWLAEHGDPEPPQRRWTVGELRDEYERRHDGWVLSSLEAVDRILAIVYGDDQ